MNPGIIEDEDTRPRAAPSDAIGELLCVCVLGLLPLLLFCIIAATKADSVVGGILAFVSPIQKGQLFLYSFSMLGSLFWLFITQVKVYDKFWLGVYTLWIAAPALTAMFFYGVNPDLDVKVHWLVVVLSAVLYGVYVWLYYSLLIHVPSRIGNLTKTMNETSDRTANRSKRFIK